MTAVQESSVNSKSSDLLTNFSYLYINYPKWLGCGVVVFLNGTICNCNCVIFHTNGLEQETIQRKMLSPVPWEALFIFSNRSARAGGVIVTPTVTLLPWLLQKKVCEKKTGWDAETHAERPTQFAILSLTEVILEKEKAEPELVRLFFAWIMLQRKVAHI